MNNVIIIADTIKVECPNLNANYSISMGEFVGTESEVDLELFAFGEYISESNSINVFWDTTIPKGTFDVQTSYDNEAYTSVVTVTDVESYNYAISEEFEKMYIKVTETTYYGEICETVPFVVTKSEDGYTIDYLDSDEDGLPDIFETEIGTKIDISDSDEDGLTDYQEIYFTDTDPTIYSSVTEGIRDADIDSDSDGLSNIFELEYEIDPLLEDTDEDSLSDYDEIYVYITHPAVPDTDEDSIDDGSEIKLGLDPNNPETFGYPDAEYSIEQQIETDSPVMSEVNTEENAYELSLKLKTNGYAEDVLSISESDYAFSIDNEAMLGISTDIEIDNSCNPENIVLKYTIKDEYLDNTLGTYADCEEFQGIKRLNVFKYFEEINMLLPIKTQFDVENNLIYAEIDELGTYCVMDMEIWLNMLGLETSEEFEEEINLSGIQLDYDTPTALSDETTYTYGDYSYTIHDGTANIIEYNGTASNLVIPDTINGYSVTEIGSRAFSWCGTLISVTIPDSVTTIEASAFASCKNLTEINIPNSITTIPKEAFAWCPNLENVNIPDSVTRIKEFAFYYTGLTSLVIPDSVKYIETHAFGVCNNLTTVNISESVKSISDAAFDLCKSLTEFNVNDNNPYYLSVDGIVYSKNQKQLVFYPSAKSGESFTVPASVTLIRDRAFTYNQNLTSITITKNVNSISDSAFVACPKLANLYVDEENSSFISIDGVLFNKAQTAIIRYPQAKNNIDYIIPNGITVIENNAFYYCQNLVKVDIPDSITAIGDYAFSNCSELSEIIIPNGITDIGRNAFTSCKSLTEITIPDSVTSIEIATFSLCSNLTKIIIPKSVQSIGASAFYNCNSLTIYGYTGSYAEEYANINNIKFVSIGSQDVSFEALVGTKWKKIKLDGILNATNGVNSDTDSLTDWQEVNTELLIWNDDGSFELPTFKDVFNFVDYIKISMSFDRWRGTNYEQSLNNLLERKVLPVLSDPTEEDSDGDGILDPDEYINLTTDSRYDNLNPLKVDTIESLYPELSERKSNNKESNPIYLEIIDNTIIINAKYKLSGLAEETSCIQVPGTNLYYTNAEIIFASINKKWDTTISGNKYDFYPGMEITIEVELEEKSFGEKYIEFKVAKNGNYTVSKSSIWSTKNNQVITLGIEENSVNSPSKNRFSAPAHEFGHALGLTDLYGYNNINWRLQPVVYDIPNTTQNEIWYTDFGDNPDGDLMYSFGLVRANDIEMILQAYCDNKEQYFRPEFDKNNDVSKAIKQFSNDNIFIDRYNKQFVKYDPITRTTTVLEEFDNLGVKYTGDFTAYQIWLMKNYNINITIQELKNVFGNVI